MKMLLVTFFSVDFSILVSHAAQISPIKINFLPSPCVPDSGFTVFLALAIRALMLRPHFHTEQKPRGRILLYARRLHWAPAEQQLCEWGEKQAMGKWPSSPAPKAQGCHALQSPRPSWTGELLFQKVLLWRGRSIFIPPERERPVLRAVCPGGCFSALNCRFRTVWRTSQGQTQGRGTH